MGHLTGGICFRFRVILGAWSASRSPKFSFSAAPISTGLTRGFFLIQIVLIIEQWSPPPSLPSAAWTRFLSGNLKGVRLKGRGEDVAGGTNLVPPRVVGVAGRTNLVPPGCGWGDKSCPPSCRGTPGEGRVLLGGTNLVPLGKGGFDLFAFLDVIPTFPKPDLLSRN